MNLGQGSVTQGWMTHPSRLSDASSCFWDIEECSRHSGLRLGGAAWNMYEGLSQSPVKGWQGASYLINRHESFQQGAYGVEDGDGVLRRLPVALEGVGGDVTLGQGSGAGRILPKTHGGSPSWRHRARREESRSR